MAAQGYPLYKHQPLPDPTSYVRLLEIVQADPGQQIACDLSTWHVDSTPVYDAISYAWGDPTPSCEVLVNGNQMVIGVNCEYVLRQMYALRNKRSDDISCTRPAWTLAYLWIDAICIDQRSTLEKNHQVARMDRIYMRAERVLACVGPHSDDSAYLMKMVNSRHPLLADAFAKAKDDSVDISLPRDMKTLVRERENRKALQKLVRALLAFLDRPYFKRVWVLQEIYLAAEVVVFCGGDSEPARILYALAQLACRWLEFSLDTRRRPAPEVLRSVYNERGLLRLASSKPVALSLQFVLSETRMLNCFDIRDRLYGVLALVNWPQGRMPMPDYGKDSFDLAIEVFELLLADTKNPLRLTEQHTWAYRLIEMFELSSRQGRLEEAIRRRGLNTEPESHVPVNSSLPCRETICRGAGCVIGYSRPNERITVGEIALKLCISSSQTNPAFLVLENMSGDTIAYANPNTMAGDYYLSPDASPMTFGKFSETRAGLIVRFTDSDSNQGKIIGLVTSAHCALDVAAPEIWPDFEIRWNTEDLIFFEWLRRQCRLDTAEDMLHMSVCGSADSSHVVISRSHDAVMPHDWIAMEAEAWISETSGWVPETWSNAQSGVKRDSVACRIAVRSAGKLKKLHRRKLQCKDARGTKSFSCRRCNIAMRASDHLQAL